MKQQVPKALRNAKPVKKELIHKFDFKKDIVHTRHMGDDAIADGAHDSMYLERGS